MIRKRVPRDGIVLDIGANIGAISLPVAAHLTQGRVYAIEPTDYAFSKLLANLALNPALEGRVTPVKTFIADSTKPASSMIACASWPVAMAPSGEPHPVHRGVPMSAICGQITLDDFVAERKLGRLSLIKIDTDGHEFAVLSGGQKCLAALRPVVIFEACEYLMTAPRPTFADFHRLFAALAYTVREPVHLTALTADQFHKRCPVGGSMDLVALPNEMRA